jgi:glycosyltransferase involved in cell wall biosynthesis
LIKVSICVITYNQQDYIEQCLRGIANQNVNFDIEVIIFDDFSTDRTWEIIQHFAKDYAYFKCYQHEQNVGMMENFTSALFKCSGEFIALCEGDDFWVDSNKLREQVDFSNENNKFGMLIHPAYEADAESNVSDILFNKGCDLTTFYLNDVLLQTGQFSPTASYFFPRTVLDKLPHWFNTATVGDLFLEIYSTKIGPIVYMPKPYACYRTNSVNSWSFHARKFDYRKNLNRSINLELDLRRCSEDFPDNKTLFNRKIAESLSAQAESYLMLSEFDCYKKAIDESIKLCELLTRTQVIMNMLRYSPRLLKLIIKFKHWFLSR